jgi:hypothetical protein
MRSNQARDQQRVAKDITRRKMGPAPQRAALQCNLGASSRSYAHQLLAVLVVDRVGRGHQDLGALPRGDDGFGGDVGPGGLTRLAVVQHDQVGHHVREP